MANQIRLFALLLCMVIVGDVFAGNCHQFFHHQQAIVAPVIAQPLVLYQAGRDVELDALADRIVQRLEQRQSIEQQQVAPVPQPLTQATTKSVMVQHCAKCHSGAAPKGGIVYDGVTALACNQITAALRSIRDESMPKDHKIPPEVKAALMEELLNLESKEGGS